MTSTDSFEKEARTCWLCGRRGKGFKKVSVSQGGGEVAFKDYGVIQTAQIKGADPSDRWECSDHSRPAVPTSAEAFEALYPTPKPSVWKKIKRRMGL